MNESRSIIKKSSKEEIKKMQKGEIYLVLAIKIKKGEVNWKKIGTGWKWKIEIYRKGEEKETQFRKLSRIEWNILFKNKEIKK